MFNDNNDPLANKGLLSEENDTQRNATTAVEPPKKLWPGSVQRTLLHLPLSRTAPARTLSSCSGFHGLRKLTRALPVPSLPLQNPHLPLNNTSNMIYGTPRQLHHHDLDHPLFLRHPSERYAPSLSNPPLCRARTAHRTSRTERVVAHGSIQLMITTRSPSVYSLHPPHDEVQLVSRA